MKLMLSLSSSITRVSRAKFDAMGKPEQDAYLKVFPHSTYAEDDQETAPKKKSITSKLAAKLNTMPRAISAFKKARNDLKNIYDTQEIASDNIAINGAMGSAALTLGGAIGGALKFGHLGAAIGSVLESSTLLAGAKFGAAAGAAIGAAPGVLIGVLIVGLWAAHKTQRLAKKTKENMKATASSKDAGTRMAEEIVKALAHAKKNGLEPWQRKALEKHYKIKLDK